MSLKLGNVAINKIYLGTTLINKVYLGENQVYPTGTPPAGGAWDLTNASYDSVSFSVSSQDTLSRAITFGDSGSKMYMVGTGSSTEEAFQYTVSPAWDLSGASYASITVGIISASSIHFKSDGSAFYFLGGQTVFQYNLSTPWNISSYSSDVSFDSSGTVSAATGIFFKDDGTKLYIVGDTADTIYQFSLSSAWDVTTASYDSVSFGVGSQDTSPRNFYIKPDGTKLFLVGNANDTIYQYTLSSAWDISSASYDSVSFVVTQDSSPRGIWFKDDGTKMYILGETNDTVYQYSL